MGEKSGRVHPDRTEHRLAPGEDFHKPESMSKWSHAGPSRMALSSCWGTGVNYHIHLKMDFKNIYGENLILLEYCQGSTESPLRLKESFIARTPAD